MIKFLNLSSVILFTFFLVSCSHVNPVNQEKSESDLKKLVKSELGNQFTFSWPFADSSLMKPRGGNTQGEKVTLDKNSNQKWMALREKNLTKFERDRRAILAMSGAYRVSFDFIETLGFTQNYTPSKPYQSWGTEYVYLIEDKSDFISLQHVLVMFFSNNKDVKAEPMVVKHWRQDWKYQDKKIHVFAGFNTWKAVSYREDMVKGKWSQSVFQVDDSPRYQAIGKWQHKGNVSSWVSNETWRPLPRREFSVRDDYNVLIGTNRHTITPSGWVLEEENLKVILDPIKASEANSPNVLAKEIGVARYERIVNHDWSAGDRYWNSTGPFWENVRNIWDDLLEEKSIVKLNYDKEGPSLFMTLFSLAEDSIDEKFSKEIKRKKIEETINSYLINN